MGQEKLEVIRHLSKRITMHIGIEKSDYEFKFKTLLIGGMTMEFQKIRDN